MTIVSSRSFSNSLFTNYPTFLTYKIFTASLKRPQICNYKSR